MTVMQQAQRRRDALERIHPDGPDVWAQVYHAIEREWATTVEDVVRRRTTIAVRGLATPGVRSEVGRVIATTTRACYRLAGPRPGLHVVKSPARFL